jgi:hypothetical protein
MKYYQTKCYHCDRIFYFGLGYNDAVDAEYEADIRECVTHAYHHDCYIREIGD